MFEYKYRGINEGEKLPPIAGEKRKDKRLGTT